MAKQEKAYLLAGFIKKINDLVFMREESELIIVVIDRHHKSERGFNKNIAACYFCPPVDGYAVFRPAANKLLRWSALCRIAGVAAHEVRHRAELLGLCKTKFETYGSLRTITNNYPWLFWLALVMFFIKTIVIFNYSKRDRDGEVDAYFVEYLAARDFRKHHNLQRIADIVQL